MPSNKTPNYNLNQWEADDRVLRTDFNADNAKIDAALRALAVGVDKGLRLVVGRYVGSGSATCSLDLSALGRPPRVLVIPGDPPKIFIYENPSSTTVSWTADHPYGAFNTSGQTYFYFALG